MPNWNEVLGEIQSINKGPHDQVRLRYLKRLQKHTGRNVLTYYSGWLQKPQMRSVNGVEFGITDADKTGFMTCSHGVKRDKGVDLVLHTPGGDIAATESIIDYLKSLYNGNVRAIIPQLAMSGGTLIALSCKQILMGRHSSIGPVDPQFGGVPAQAIIEEFERAASEIKADPSRIPIWQPIIAKYQPALIINAQHAIDWADSILRTCLSKGMLKDVPEPDHSARIDKIADLLGKQKTSKSHNRHIGPDKARELGIEVVSLEDDQTLQNIVLTLHHAYTITLQQTSATKILENHNGIAFVNQAMVERAALA